MASYSEKLRDPRWQRKRLEKLQQQDFLCESCSDGQSTLHVHHRFYERGHDPWDYDLDQLEVLCEVCHEAKHEQLAILNRVIANASYLDLEAINCIVAGYLVENEPHRMVRERILNTVQFSDLGAETVKAGRIAARAEKKLFGIWIRQQDEAKKEAL